MDTKLTDNLAAMANRVAGALRHLSSCQHRIQDAVNERDEAEQDAVDLLGDFDELEARWFEEE